MKPRLVIYFINDLDRLISEPEIDWSDIEGKTPEEQAEVLAEGLKPLLTKMFTESKVGSVIEAKETPKLILKPGGKS